MRWRNDSSLLPLLIMTSLLLMVATPLAAQPGNADAGKRVRFEASIANLRWDALAELDAVAPGQFRKSGFGIGGGAHWMIKDNDRVDLLLGADLFSYTNDSSIRHVANDLTFRALQITPSMKLSFDDGDGPRFLLALGIGYYDADMTEINTYWWGLQTERQLWSDSTLGGYIGFDIDFPRRRRNTESGFFMSFRLHDVDFGTIADEAYGGRSLPTLGPDAGILSGSLTTLHFGYHWLR